MYSHITPTKCQVLFTIWTEYFMLFLGRVFITDIDNNRGLLGCTRMLHLPTTNAVRLGVFGFHFVLFLGRTHYIYSRILSCSHGK